MRHYVAALLSIVAIVTSAAACAKAPPRSIEALRGEVRQVHLQRAADIEGGAGFSAQLYRYESGGLQVYAMVARPTAMPPDRGWPVLIANHGHHPDPPQYGITADGKNHRPGDYYRRIPELFVAAGYLVVMPDYRGHNSSEGFEFTEGMLESAYYTEDVLNLLAGLDDIDGVDTDNVFMWGHSMGGEVTLRSVVTTGRVRGASLWSSVGGDIWDQSYYYSRYADPAAPDSSATDKYVITRLRGRIAQLDGAFDTESVEPYRYLDDLQTPLIIHHSLGDRGAAYKWSEQLAKELYMRGKHYEFWSYAGDKHLFDEADMKTAVARDLRFFRSLQDDSRE